MFRSTFDHLQGDIIFPFTSVTKDKIIGFVVACLLYLLCLVLMFDKHNTYKRRTTTNPISLSSVNEVKEKNIYLPEDGQKLTETCWRILRLLKQYDHFNVLF